MLAVLPGVIVAALSATDPMFGWLLVFVMIPIAVAGGLIAVVAGVIGVVYTGIRRQGYGWPVAGILLGVVLVASVVFVFSPVSFF